MKRIIELPDKVVKAIQNGEDYRYDIHTAIAQSIPYSPTGDAISREALKEAISKVVAEERKEDERWAAGLRYALTLIDNAQAIEQNWRFYYDHGYAQAKRDFERPQGKWIAKEETPASVYYCCSNCGMEGVPVTPYCPWCGAQMKGGAE